MNLTWKELTKLITRAAVEAIMRYGIQPDSYAWRCWWEIQA